jgi:hypothetical protein
VADSVSTPRNHNFVDLTGQKFHGLTVLAYAGRNKGGNSLWLCRCACGNEKVCKTASLRASTSNTVSCGCAGRAGLAVMNTARQEIVPPDKIILAGGHVCLVDPEDLPLVSQFSWHALKSHGKDKWYAKRNTPSKVLMHVLLMGGKGVDHRNGNGLDNRRDNLRFASRSQNAQNAAKPRTSSHRFKGVVPPRGRLGAWGIRITVDGKQRTFGGFATEEEAARAYDRKAREVFGEFAWLNFPEAT